MDVNGKKFFNEYLFLFLIIVVKYEVLLYYIVLEVLEIDFEFVICFEMVVYMVIIEGFDCRFFDDNGVEVVWEVDFVDVCI